MVARLEHHEAGLERVHAEDVLGGQAPGVHGGLIAAGGMEKDPVFGSTHVVSGQFLRPRVEHEGPD